MSTLTIPLEAAIPAWLSREVESRLAFIDEDIIGARIDPAGHTIKVTLRIGADRLGDAKIVSRVHRLIATLATAIEPRVQVLEEHRTSPPGCGCDLDALLLDTRQAFCELPGV